jgi:hypothetical protein
MTDYESRVHWLIEEAHAKWAETARLLPDGMTGYMPSSRDDEIAKRVAEDYRYYFRWSIALKAVAYLLGMMTPWLA